MKLKLGCKPPRHTRKTLKYAVMLGKHLDALGTPPPVVMQYVEAVEKQVGDDWGMFLNDKLSDCTAADHAHCEMIWTANAGQLYTPTDADVLAFYEGCTGYDPNAPLVHGENPTDQGADLTSVCQYAQTTGFNGRKLDAFANVDWTNKDHMLWALQLMGCVKLGVRLPQSAEREFAEGKPWTWNPSSPSLGGHDIILFGRSANGWQAGSWGKRVQVSDGFVEYRTMEAVVPLSLDWIADSGSAPNGHMLNELEDDLGELEAE